MNRTVANILRRVLVKSFYKDNTGFFLFWFFLLFGAVSGGQLIGFHLSLINGIIQSFVFLGCVMIAWLLYTLKCNSYIRKKLKDPHNNFLQAVSRIDGQNQYIQLLWVHIQIYMPVFLYTLIVAAIAFKKEYYASMIFTLTGNSLMIILSAFLYRFCLQKKEIKSPGFLDNIHFNLPKPLFSLPLWFIIRERRQIFFTVKLFTFAIIYLFAGFYEPERHDIRPLMLILLLVVAAHSFLVLRVRDFEETYLGFSRSLPVNTIERFAGLVALYSIMLLPELIFIWRAYPAAFNKTDFPELWLFTISLLLFFHSLLLMKDIDPDSYIRVMFISCAVVFFAVLYNPGILFSIAILALAFIFFHYHFYTFEKTHENIEH